MAEKVEYRLQLQSNGSYKLNEVAASAEKAGVQLGKTKVATAELSSALDTMIGSVTRMVAIYAGFSGLKSAYDLNQKQISAVTRLTQVYYDNSKFTLENLENLKKLAITQEGVTGVYREQIEAGEVMLLKHHDIRVSYEQLLPAIANYAKATGQTFADASTQFARALGNPNRAVQTLRMAGIDLTKEQLKWMNNMYESGKYADYQSMVLKQLQERFEGTAEAMLKANPGEQINLVLRQSQVALGEFERKVLIDALPVIEKLILDIKDGALWFQKNKESIETLGKAIIGIGIIWAGYNILIKGAAFAMGLLTFATKAQAFAIEILEPLIMGLAVSGFNPLVAAEAIALNYSELWTDQMALQTAATVTTTSSLGAMTIAVKGLAATLTLLEELTPLAIVLGISYLIKPDEDRNS